jgi:hypothetical protein
MHNRPDRESAKTRPPLTVEVYRIEGMPIEWVKDGMEGAPALGNSIGATLIRDLR